ncbi:unnamed protein product, partial [Closterium sp. Naga37s-1]
IRRSDFGFPTWFSAGAKRLITGILQPNPKLRYRYQEIKKDAWFRTNYVPVPVPVDTADDNMNDVDAAFGAAPAAPAAAAAPSGAVKSAAPGGAASGTASGAAKSAAGSAVSAGSAGSALAGSENATGTCKGSGSSVGTSGCATCAGQQQQQQQQVQTGSEGPGDLKGSHRGGLSCQLGGLTPTLNHKSGRGVEHTPYAGDVEMSPAVARHSVVAAVVVEVFVILPGLLMVEMRHESGGTQESIQCLPFSPASSWWGCGTNRAAHRKPCRSSLSNFAILPVLPIFLMMEMRLALRAKLQDLIAAPHTPNTAKTANDKSSKGKGTGLKQTRPRQLAAYPRMGIIPRV